MSPGVDRGATAPRGVGEPGILQLVSETKRTISHGPSPLRLGVTAVITTSRALCMAPVPAPMHAKAAPLSKVQMYI